MCIIIMLLPLAQRTEGSVNTRSSIRRSADTPDAVFIHRSDKPAPVVGCSEHVIGIDLLHSAVGSVHRMGKGMQGIHRTAGRIQHSRAQGDALQTIALVCQVDQVTPGTVGDCGIRRIKGIAHGGFPDVLSQSNLQGAVGGNVRRNRRHFRAGRQRKPRIGNRPQQQRRYQQQTRRCKNLLLYFPLGLIPVFHSQYNPFCQQAAADSIVSLFPLCCVLQHYFII